MADLETRIAQGRGDMPADLVLRGGRMFDLVTGEMLTGDVAICGDQVVGICDTYDGREVIDVSGLTLVPGFIDTHLHIESSLVTPFEFDRCVAPHGVTTAICDPHEIANVIGPDGIRWFQAASERTVMDIRVQLSSCVPSTEMETAGARIDAADLAPLMGHASGIGLAEFMNYPGVIHRDPGAMAKLALFAGGHVDGHCPQLTGRDLNAYIAAGIRTEHEATTAEEALEKLRKGMRVLIREGSVSKDLNALQPLLNERTAPYMCLCTDDRNPLDIAEQGHLDYMIRTLISLGTSPLAAYRAASLSAAEAFGLKDRGMIAPGQRADIVAVGSLEACDVQAVFCAGQRVDARAFDARGTLEPIGRNSVKAPRLEAAHFRAKANREDTDVIGIVEGRIITEHLKEQIAIEDGDKRPDPARDLARIAVVERHGKNGNIATGFVRGFGLKSGAIASTVCHDHHNIACVGVDYADMALAANRLGEIEGGFVVAQGGRVLAELALPVAGLMSLAPFEDVRDRLVELRDAAVSLGVELHEPFLQLAFLALPVIPALKITDRGMVDVTRFEIIG
ncbi:adenine deaminase [Pseudohalocynthiibacter aestuariivivens]|uniref:Adenine deaminase n=1 Tax=Roseovarius pelagicus TaxID=2980108 RepID=A0ABY6DB88_9RHOB|nr:MULTISPECIES: adenine deaminase [Rhodobacterales]QIE44698.1 adenine deaminase [Pseudohalocynthiibacter aestuariivivens]UXX83391.1 adenine deaminase [Roseovarius pelagicus]